MEKFAALASVSGFIAVATGAFGAHALKTQLNAEMLTVWQTAVQYHFWHTLAALVAAALLYQMPDASLLRISGWLFLAGIALFCGSLYALALSEIRVLGVITPIGGVLFLAGWACMAIAVWKIP